LLIDATGHQTSDTLSTSISITEPYPIVIIDHPENTTYSTKNIPLNFSIIDTNPQNYWFDIGNGSNTTIIGNTTIQNVLGGSRTVILYVNDTSGQINSSQISFYVAESFNIIWTNFNGSTTNFTALTDEQLASLSNIIIESTNKGKIIFTDTISITSDLNLNQNINISSNFIEVNITHLTQFNVSATLHFYNLNFTNPRPVRNGEVCPTSICTEVSYTGGEFIYTVTSFSNYSSEETPTTPSSPTTTGGGGAAPGEPEGTEEEEEEEEERPRIIEEPIETIKEALELNIPFTNIPLVYAVIIFGIIAILIIINTTPYFQKKKKRRKK